MSLCVFIRNYFGTHALVIMTIKWIFAPTSVWCGFCFGVWARIESIAYRNIYIAIWVSEQEHQWEWGDGGGDVVSNMHNTPNRFTRWIDVNLIPKLIRYASGFGRAREGAGEGGQRFPKVSHLSPCFMQYKYSLVYNFAYSRRLTATQNRKKLCH